LAHAPREYPKAFGQHMAAKYDSFVTTTRGNCPLPNPVPSAIDSFLKMENGGKPGLDFARLGDVFNYLRRGKHLVIPEAWKPYISDPF